MNQSPPRSGGDSIGPPVHQATPFPNSGFVPNPRKRIRSNPGFAPLGAILEFPAVSDPDIDLNAHTAKRHLSEAMANDLTRHMSLKFSGRDAAPLTPPGGCSPQRTGISMSEMSEGGPEVGDDHVNSPSQPMLMSDVSGKASGPEASTSETIDSEVLEERDIVGSPWPGLGPNGGNSASADGMAPNGLSRRMSETQSAAMRSPFRSLLLRGPLAEMPTSPSDSRFGYDLRKTALLRSISRRTEEPMMEAQAMEPHDGEGGAAPGSAGGGPALGMGASGAMLHGSSTLRPVHRSNSTLSDGMDTSSNSAGGCEEDDAAEADGAVGTGQTATDKAAILSAASSSYNPSAAALMRRQLQQGLSGPSGGSPLQGVMMVSGNEAPAQAVMLLPVPAAGGDMTHIPSLGVMPVQCAVQLPPRPPAARLHQRRPDAGKL